MDIFQGLPLRTQTIPPVGERNAPVYLYTIGSERQQAITRVRGYSAKQLLVVVSGEGVFRTLGQTTWHQMKAPSLLYIPDGLPHEYAPTRGEPWLIGFVTFVEDVHQLMERWGFGRTFFTMQVAHTTELMERITDMWDSVGSQADDWDISGRLLSFLHEVKRYLVSEKQLHLPASKGVVRYPDRVVDAAVQFVHDHLERTLTVQQLATFVGYSPKQLTRLFHQSVGQTPLQYVLAVRLRVAANLLHEQRHLTISQIAAHVGMEPDYLSRQFRRQYGCTPSTYRGHVT